MLYIAEWRTWGWQTGGVTVQPTVEGLSQGSGAEHMHIQSKDNTTRPEDARDRKGISKDRFTRSRDYPSEVTQPLGNVTSPSPWYCGLLCPEHPQSIMINHLGLVHLYGQLQRTWHLSKQNKSTSCMGNLRKTFSLIWVSTMNTFLWPTDTLDISRHPVLSPPNRRIWFFHPLTPTNQILRKRLPQGQIPLSRAPQ